MEKVDVDCVMLPARLTLLDQSTCDADSALRSAAAFSILAIDNLGMLVTGPVHSATYDYGQTPAMLDRLRRIVNIGP